MTFDSSHPAVTFAKAVQQHVQDNLGKQIAYTEIKKGPKRWGLAEVVEGEAGYRDAKAPVFTSEEDAKAAAAVINDALGLDPQTARRIVLSSFRIDEEAGETPPAPGR